MKVCFPTACNLGMESPILEHFGAAPMYLLVDSKTGEIEERSNRDKGHDHGHCQPLKALGGAAFDALVVGGIGRGALAELHRSGHKVFQAVPGTISVNLSRIAAGQLEELTANDVCAGHGGLHRHGHGSGHGTGCGC